MRKTFKRVRKIGVEENDLSKISPKECGRKYMEQERNVCRERMLLSKREQKNVRGPGDRGQIYTSRRYPDREEYSCLLHV